MENIEKKELNVRIVETDGSNPDVQMLCRELFAFFDEVVALKNTEEYEKYDSFDAIKLAFLAYVDDRPAGCACYSEYSPDTIEGRHFYIRPEYRGTVVAKKIHNRMTEKCVKMGYRRLICASGEMLERAMALYRRIGYREIEPYGPFVGMQGCICMEYVFPQTTEEKQF